MAKIHEQRVLKNYLKKSIDTCGTYKTEVVRLILDAIDQDYGKVIVSGKRVIKMEIHTGGWSENEYVIGLLRSSLFWTLSWRKSVVGGHHYFRIK